MTRRKILRAALGEFAHRGFDGTSIRSAGAAAGVANGTVYLAERIVALLYKPEDPQWAQDGRSS